MKSLHISEIRIGTMTSVVGGRVCPQAGRAGSKAVNPLSAANAKSGRRTAVLQDPSDFHDLTCSAIASWSAAVLLPLSNCKSSSAIPQNLRPNDRFSDAKVHAPVTIFAVLFFALFTPSFAATVTLT